MDTLHFTVGMAGHIDHGKTSLTKALTNIETDRLKEEKERNISIELGYAPLELGEGMEVSIIDVPGHERFIRQMIAGVAGIDMVILVVAADEGVMPQTREHVEILNFLGIEHALVALTKISRVEEEMLELVEEDVKEQLEGTIFAEAPMISVDSLDGTGIDKLRATIKQELEKTEIRDVRGAFRLPIDQVFTVQGQGTVVRGTVYEGYVEKNSSLVVLPAGLEVKARQIQVHHHDKERAVAGQRAAINLGGISRHELKRGDVLVSSRNFVVTDTIDVTMTTVKSLRMPLKQRSPIKLHIGTTEVMGKIIFFDRNELEDGREEVLCQFRLDHKIVTKRGDRFIVRRPTPVETVGGGWVIDPKGEKYRFGNETMAMLGRKKESTPIERIIFILTEEKLLSKKDILKFTSLDEAAFDEAVAGDEARTKVDVMPGGYYALIRDRDEIINAITEKLALFHEEYPLRAGINKAEIIQSLTGLYPKRLLDYVIEKAAEEGKFDRRGQFIALGDFTPHYPKAWKTRMANAEEAMAQDGIEVKPFTEYAEKEGIPAKETEEFKQHLIQTEKGYPLDEQLLISKQAMLDAVRQVHKETAGTFTLQEAKSVLGLSRKYLVPLLEQWDNIGITVRGGQERKWVATKLDELIKEETPK